jgi:hypothetical protein
VCFVGALRFPQALIHVLKTSLPYQNARPALRAAAPEAPVPPTLRANAPVMAVLKTNGDGRLHYHAMIDRPNYCSFETLKDAITNQWQRTDFGYRQIGIQDAADADWTDCMLKLRQKISLLDSIDWNNCNLIAE